MSSSSKHPNYGHRSIKPLAQKYEDWIFFPGQWLTPVGVSQPVIELMPLPDGIYYLSFTTTDFLEHDYTTDAIEIHIEGGSVVYYAK